MRSEIIILSALFFSMISFYSNKVRAADIPTPAVNVPATNCSTGAPFMWDSVNGKWICQQSTTVAGLPACNASNEGQEFIVTNALLPSILASVIGGGSVHVNVKCLNNLWIII